MFICVPTWGIFVPKTSLFVPWRSTNVPLRSASVSLRTRSFHKRSQYHYTHNNVSLGFHLRAHRFQFPGFCILAFPPWFFMFPFVSQHPPFRGFRHATRLSASTQRPETQVVSPYRQQGKERGSLRLRDPQIFAFPTEKISIIPLYTKKVDAVYPLADYQHVFSIFLRQNVSAVYRICIFMYRVCIRSVSYISLYVSGISPEWIETSLRKPNYLFSSWLIFHINIIHQI